tara:strand:+ start:1306 stop:1467 length:162 start_codon:yes stop_codon:yes gene_type:complete
MSFIRLRFADAEKILKEASVLCVIPGSVERELPPMVILFLDDKYYGVDAQALR